jgi:colicin import membrane protein
MPRKLKTFITNIGFFELALAAPSMKAALEAWGMGHNAFQHGFAKQTDDPKIVAATMAQPGVVLRRAVGTKGEFTEHSEGPEGRAYSAKGQSAC